MKVSTTSTIAAPAPVNGAAVAAFTSSDIDAAVKAVTIPTAAPVKEQLSTNAKPLSAKTRVNAQQSKEMQIGCLLVNAGEALGTYTASDAWDRKTCGEVMDNALRAAMKAGLTVDMLKAGKPAYIALVDSIQNVRVANDMEPLANGTRDNYLSRIRAFIAARGAQPLDIFGNLKAAAMKLAKGKSGTTSGKGKKSGPVDIHKVVDMKGAPSLGKFLAVWIEANDGNQGLLQLRKMAQDLLTAVNVATGVKK
jgi:hypothetical protein